MISEDVPWRSGVTALNDDDLALLDAFALLGPLNEQVLCRERYGDLMNTTYTHSLSNRALHAWVKSMTVPPMSPSIYDIFGFEGNVQVGE